MYELNKINQALGSNGNYWATLKSRTIVQKIKVSLLSY